MLRHSAKKKTYVEITGAVERAVQRIGTFDVVPEKRTAQKALLKRLDKELAVIYDDLNLPVAVGTCAEQLRMAASLLELWRTCVVVIDRVPLKAIPDGVFRTVMLLINRSPHDVSSAAPSSSLTTRSSTTPTRPASFPATSLPSPSAAGR